MVSKINPNPFTTRPEIEGTFGVVTSTHWIATAVGMATLEKGGNAFDAAVATAFTLQVVEPHLNGPGGDVPVIVHDVRRGKVEVICGQGPAPQAATIAHYRGLGLDLVPGTGLLAACVPGMFETWMLLLRDYGTMHLTDVLAPAISYARDGSPIGRARQRHHRHGRAIVPRALADLGGGLSARRQSAGAGHHVQPTATLADTYARIVAEAESAGGDRERQIEKARACWSRGFVAEAIDKFCRTQEVMDTSGERHRGVLTADDMARWQPTIEPPATLEYGNYTVCKGGFWSQGPVMLQQLALLRGFALDGADPASTDFIHTVVECTKLAFADREKFYGDPKFAKVPEETLLSEAYNAERRKLIGDTASLEQRPGTIKGFGKELPLRVPAGARTVVAGAGEPTVGKIWTHDDTHDPGVIAVDDAKLDSAGVMRGDTVHFDIIDRQGNMVSSTPSGGWLQSSPTIPELGFCLGSRAQQFWLDEGHPASLAPGKRPRTTLTPTMALRDGEPYLAWGSPGGDQQDQWTAQFFLRHVHAKMNLQEAIDAPAWHSEHFPASFWPREARPGVLVVEGRLSADTIKELRRRGHIVEVAGDWTEGRLTAASRVGKRRRAAANPRGMQGYAAGR